MTDAQSHLDPELFELCVRAFDFLPASDENHTVAAAVRSHSGKTFVALNVYHFTGGPCAELSVLGTAAASGVLASDIETIVAVCRREGNVFRVINPCGRCRQTLLDYNPEIKVIVLNTEGKEVMAKVRDLMVYAYVWEDGNTGRKEEEKVPRDFGSRQVVSHYEI
ncbi:cytidine deaminase-like protein [Chaetomidium leptoderma]|uniref:Cytidine deaminase-like protein n=1 Tax=Chaetomidium leptoderma TaxID=669021 RepID=A0AAN6VFH1_9PEZI|nr:cytidine deaminase-like protein [Chaetomidium leptoderma]